MTNDELNQYIKHYIEKDHTGRAIMLTGPWGSGKSYYINNSLIPYLAKSENNGHKCIVVSLYGLTDLSEISKAIYLEARAINRVLESESARAAVITGKTVIKGVASIFGIDFSIKEEDLQKLYESIDLTGKLVVFEDVERTGINLIQFLGYVNNMTEHDDVKVLLVTNEKEITEYEPFSPTESTAMQKSAIQGEKSYTYDAEMYLRTKEKTVEDTITFFGDFNSAIKAIVETFDNITIKRFAYEQHVNTIVGMMTRKRNYNLRSILYACQKTVDIFERLSNIEALPEDFIHAIFFGVVSFSLTIHHSQKVRWEGSEYYSIKLGNQEYPLFKFCYDYILFQRLDNTIIAETIAAFNILTEYNHNKDNPDSDLILIEKYLIHTEKEVKETVDRLASRLQAPDDVAFRDYGRVAAALITLKDKLNIEVEGLKKLLVDNIKTTQKELDEDEIIWFPPNDVSEKASEEYELLREEILLAVYEKNGIIPGFNYLPEQAEYFKDYVSNNIKAFQKKGGFARFLDVKKLTDMYSQCTPMQMNCLYLSFQSIYNDDAWQYFREDVLSIDELIKGIDLLWKNPDFDKVQQLHSQRFVEELASIRAQIG